MRLNRQENKRIILKDKLTSKNRLFKTTKGTSIKLLWCPTSQPWNSNPRLRNVKFINEKLFTSEIKNQIIQNWTHLPKILKKRIDNNSLRTSQYIALKEIRFMGDDPFSETTPFKPLILNEVKNFVLTLEKNLAKKSQLETSVYKFIIKP